MRFRKPVVAVLLLVLAGAPACSKKKPSPDKAGKTPSASPSAVKIGFKATAVQAVDAGDRPQANEKANQVAAQVVDLVNSYYAIAFVDPGKWVNGTHPELPGVFLPELRDQVGGQLQGLALGDVAPKLTSVKPDREEVHVKVFVTGDDLSAPVVAINTFFEGTAEAKSKSDGPVKVSHHMAALLQPEGGGYKIAGGSAELRADSPSGAFAPFGRAVLGVQP